MLKAAARYADRALGGAPFKLRAGLLVQMLAFYDELRRRNVTVDTFERLLTGDLERDADVDRGAERLLRQTTFLAAAYRGYESRLRDAGGLDEHALRARLVDAEPSRPLRHLIVTVAEHGGESAGLWPADFELLTRLPRLERIDLVATRSAIAAGFLDRLQKFMPGFEEAELPNDGGGAEVGQAPVLVSPADRPYWLSRDREDELASIARRLKDPSIRADPLDRKAIVFKKPLPYVYLAREIFSDAGIPYQAFDAFPLAAEPYAATLDLVFEFVSSEFTRASVVALLSSPHLNFEVDGVAINRQDVGTLNRALSDTGYLGGLAWLEAFAGTAHGRASRGARAAATAAEELSALYSAGTAPSVQLASLLKFLATHDRLPRNDDPLRERHLRARSAILSAVQALRRAHEEIDDRPVALLEVAGIVRRWIEGQTFAPRIGTSGVQVMDAQAARYGEFDEIFLVGLIEGEWPERAAKNIFYPSWLLSQLDWPAPKAALEAERATFRDLLSLPRRRVSVSSFELENDSIVAPSMFIDEIASAGLLRREPAAISSGRIFVHEALSGSPAVASAVGGEAAEWLALRTSRSQADSVEFHGGASPFRPVAYTVSSLERYLECPFRYFAEKVLRLEEDPEDETALTPKELGIFVHQVFQAFFEEWGRRGEGAITPDNLSNAREVFAEVIEPLLQELPEGEAAVQRTRLLGSAADEGLAEAVFQIEAEWQTPVVERLLEHELTGEFEIQGDGEARRVSLRGKADRVDLLADDTFRIIDYKLGSAPDRKLALQLPIYSVCTVHYLRGARGENWKPGQAGYIALGSDRRFVSMLGREKDTEATLREAQNRLLNAIDAIERGEFPPRPHDIIMCTRCEHASVCRKDYVGDV
jgi:RecB family exonuclease